jgi:leucyl/phenylalanyl-tRNA--protein transferase
MIPWLDPGQPPYFPDTASALEEPNGLLAAGGKLGTDWLLVAYRQGIFPWFSNKEPILWWTPAPRTVIFPENFHSSKSLNKLWRQNRYRITQNKAFPTVIRECAAPRDNQSGTWIVKDMVNAYIAMHEAGFARSIECWDEGDRLVGGLYGIFLGKVFFGESMFSLEESTSKLCLKYLVESGDYELIDCQLPTEHLALLGAVEIGRSEFERLLDRLV